MLPAKSQPLTSTIGIFLFAETTFRAASLRIKSVAFAESPDEKLGHSPPSETRISIDGRTKVTRLCSGPPPNMSINVQLVRNSGTRPSSLPSESKTRTSKKVTGSNQPPLAEPDSTNHPDLPAASFNNPSRSEDPRTRKGNQKPPRPSKPPNIGTPTTARLSIVFRRAEFCMLHSNNEFPITLTPLPIRRSYCTGLYIKVA